MVDSYLIKKILKFVDNNRRPDGQKMTLCIEGYGHDDVQYHARLCVDAGWFRRLQGPVEVYPIELTYSGHQKLQQLQNQGPGTCPL